MAESDKPLSYRDSGVDIDAGEELVNRIKPMVEKTRRPGVLQGLGGFGALFELPINEYRNPVLVSGTDGVGTKLKLAQELGIHHTIGIDLVAMCVNDIVVCGAEPLFFLDYFATGKLDVAEAECVVKGIADGCETAGCALVGGETAEMPGMYSPGEYDLAGFAVGVVEKEDIILPDNVQAGDILIGLASSGAHSNGYSLIRKIIEHSGCDLSQPFGSSTLGQCLLAPTRIYVKPILNLIRTVNVSAICHITGGGFVENLPRVLANTNTARIFRSKLPNPIVFEWIKDNGNVRELEMLRTFNCGIGMVVVVHACDAEIARTVLESAGEQTYVIGEIINGNGGIEIVD